MAESLDIIIVNWNSGLQLRRCLDSIQTHSSDFPIPLRVIVVDNASSDGSANALDFPRLSLLRMSNSQNLGFAAACNMGAKNSSADYFLFLNPDTLLAEGSLSAPIQFMRMSENSDVGVCGIQLLDDQGEVVHSCRRFPRPNHFYSHALGLNQLFPALFEDTLMTEWNHAETRAVDQVVGAFFLVRRNVFERQGGFDKRFFMYFEEVDFLRTARRDGWQCYFLPTAHAYHKGGGCSQQAKAARLFYSLRSRVLYSYKHFSWVAATSVLLSTLFIEPFTRLALAAMQGSASAMRETLEAYRMLWRALPELRRANVNYSQHDHAAPRPLRSESVN